MKLFLELCLVLFVLNCVLGDKNTFRNLMRFLSRNSSVPIYRPNMDSGTPTEVGVSLYIIGIHTVEEDNGQLQVDCYLRTMWNAPSLIFPNNSGYEEIHMNPANAERYIWLPDLYMVQARDTWQHTTINEDGVIILREDGNVHRSAKKSFVLSCPFDLSSFPFDTQECTLSFESYAGSVDDLTLTWNGDVPLIVNSDITGKKNAFKYKDFKTAKKIETVATASYERLEVTFKMQRHASHYIVLYYLPTTFLIILGGLMFWLPLTSLQERTFYGSFLFLTSTIFVTSCQFGTPSVGYMKAIDVWCVACMGFLFAAVVEVIILHLLRTKYTQHSTSTFHQMKEEEECKTADTANLTPTASFIFRGGRIIPYLDLALKIAYPVAFVLFIIGYASVYH